MRPDRFTVDSFTGAEIASREGIAANKVLLHTSDLLGVSVTDSSMQRLDVGRGCILSEIDARAIKAAILVDSFSLRGDAELTFLQEQEAVTETIDHVDTVADAVFALEEFDLRRTAKRVAFLADIHRKDPDEPELDLHSLKRLVAVMRAKPTWGEPSLTLRDGGYVHAEWPTRGGGRIAMAFVSEDRIVYSAIEAPAGAGKKVRNIGGYHDETEALQSLNWFTSRIS